MARIILTTILGLTLALVLVACGGSNDEVSADELEARIAEAQENVQSELEGLSDAGSADELSEDAGQAADAIREEADSLADTEPPQELEGARDQFVESLRTLADQLEQQTADIGEADLDQLRQQLQGLDSQDLQGVLDDLRDSGIEIPTTDAP